jgi:hypothetical protein
MHVLKRQETGLIYMLKLIKHEATKQKQYIYSLSIHRIQIQKWAKS